MLVIGELINGMYTQIGKAIQSKDKAVIQKVAKDQESAGADMLDVNTGPASSNPVEDMKWLIEVIQEVSNLPLALDSTKPKVIEEGLKLVKVKAMINSTIADEERLGALIPLAKQYGASIIGLKMDKKGPPQDRHKRSELAAMIVSACMDAGMDLNDLYIDPIILPVNVAQPQVTEVLETIRDIKLLSDPSPKTVVGLSNVSQGTKDRNLINRTFLIMALACGLEAAIMDPLDKELMEAMITSELLLNKSIYCDSFLNAYHK